MITPPDLAGAPTDGKVPYKPGIEEAELVDAPDEACVVAVEDPDPQLASVTAAANTAPTVPTFGRPRSLSVILYTLTKLTIA